MNTYYIIFPGYKWEFENPSYVVEQMPFWFPDISYRPVLYFNSFFLKKKS